MFYAIALSYGSFWRDQKQSQVIQKERLMQILVDFLVCSKMIQIIRKTTVSVLKLGQKKKTFEISNTHSKLKEQYFLYDLDKIMNTSQAARKEYYLSKLHVYFSVCVGVGVMVVVCVFKYIYTLTEHLLYFALGLFPPIISMYQHLQQPHSQVLNK